MKLVLNPFLLRFTNPRIFFAPSDGAGGGEGGAGGPTSGDPGNSGGGGGSGGGGEGDPNADILDFAAPDISDALSAISGEPKPDPVAPPTPPKGKKTDPTPPAPPKGKKEEPTTPPANDPPAKQLRTELEATKAELATLKQTLEKGDPRIAEAQAAVKAKEQEIADRDKRIAEYERQLNLANPAVRQKLTDLDTKYNQSSQKFFTRVPELDQPRLQALVREYAQLPFGKEGYREARAAFEANVNKALGGDENVEHRKLSNVLDFVEGTYDFINERNGIAQEIERDAHKLAREATTKEFTEKKTHISGLIEKAKGVPEGLKDTDPMHPRVALNTFMEALGEKATEFDKGIPEFVELALLGATPRDESAYAGMTPQQVAESKAKEAERASQARDHLVDVAVNGLRALRIFPTLVREWKRLSEKVGEESDDNPPDPTGGGGAGGGGGKPEDDIKSFTPPNLADLRF